MSLTLSTSELCRRALPREALEAEDENIIRMAERQRRISHVVQCLLLAADGAAIIWIYNDPNRQDNESVHWSLYPLAVGGALGLGAVSVYHIQRWFRDQDKRTSWVVDPLYAIFSFSGLASVGLVLTNVKAQKIYDSIRAANLLNQEEINNQSKLNELHYVQCLQKVYDQRESFTSSNCTICVQPGNSFRGDVPGYYQAQTRDWESQLWCAPTKDWDKLESFKDDATVGEGPCRNQFFNYSAPDYSMKQRLSSAFNIWPPMEVVVSDFNESCRFVNATGTFVDFSSSTLCWAPDLFILNPSSPCPTPEWNAFALNLSQNYDGEMPQYVYTPTPGPVSAIMYGNDFVWQEYGAGVLFLFSTIALIAKIVAKTCRRQRPPQVLEMESLTEATQD